MPVANYYKILFLPKWYPNRKDKFNGIFIERHAQAIAKHCKVAVLFVGPDNLLQKKHELVHSMENNLNIVRVYYKNSDVGSSLLGKAIKFIRYLQGFYLGLKFVKSDFGKPNLVHVHVLTRPGLIALLLKKINKIPYIITEHWSGYMPADGTYKGLLKKWSTKWVVKNAAHITCVSKHLAAAMKDHELHGNYSIIGNCIDPPVLTNKVIPASMQAILIGNLEDREKNISPVIQALNALRDEFPELKLCIIGKGKDKENLVQLCHDLKLNDRVNFLDEVAHEAVLEYLVQSSFLILNSNFETFSVVAAEALACGTPVLATRSGGPEDFILPEFGKLISPNSQEDLQNGMRWMCNNQGAFDKTKMKQYVLDNFSSEKIAEQFISIYHPLISQWEAGNTREKITIPSTWKVLDVGSGDHPNERADVLLEREIEATEHRSGAKAVIPDGKKLVLGDATCMPFDNKEFDFVIASHIAEHIDEPEKFCSELQRVAKSGYIETPDAFSEFIFNEQFHKWVVSNKNGVLVFKEKTKHTVFSELFYRFYYLNEKRSNHEALYSRSIFLITLVNLIRKCWKYLPRTYTRFHWNSKFEFKVIRKS